MNGNWKDYFIVLIDKSEITTREHAKIIGVTFELDDAVVCQNTTLHYTSQYINDVMIMGSVT